MDDTMPAQFRLVTVSTMNFVIALFILAGFAWEALLAVPIFAVAYWRIMNIYRWPGRDLKRLEALARSPAMGHFSDSCKGASTIRAYRQDVRFMLQNIALVGNAQRTTY